MKTQIYYFISTSETQGRTRVGRAKRDTWKTPPSISWGLFEILAGIPLIHNRMKASFRSSVFPTNMASFQTCLTAHVQCIKCNNKTNQRASHKYFCYTDQTTTFFLHLLMSAMMCQWQEAVMTLKKKKVYNSRGCILLKFVKTKSQRGRPETAFPWGLRM